MNTDVIISRISEVSFVDYPTAKGSCITYFLYGCDFKCKGCQNEELQCGRPHGNGEFLRFNYINDFAMYIQKQDIRKNRSNGLVVLQGGDPLSQINRSFISETMKYIMNNQDNFNLKFCIYTGYDINNALNALASSVDVSERSQFLFNIGKIVPFIKCGTYEQTCLQTSGKRNGNMHFASRNQKLYKFNEEKRSYDCISYDGIAALQ